MRAIYIVLFGFLCAASAADRKPNIIFVLADDLGYGELGCFGAKEISTPVLDRMAAEGMRFTQFYAGSPVCAPSRSALMTGLHTGHTRVRGNAGKGNQIPQTLRTGDVTIAELLKGAGYRTALIGKWGLAPAGTEGVPTKKGFDYFYGYLDQGHAHNPYPPFIMRNEERVKLRNQLMGPAGEKEDGTGAGVAKDPLDFVPDLMAQEVLKWVEQNKEQPFFLYWSLITPHANNEGTRHGRGQEVPDLGQYKDKPWPEPDRAHAATITRLDADLGRLLELLKKLNLDENTLVIFSSDNGPHREGGNSPDFFQASGPFTGIKRNLKDGGIRVPTIFRWPGTIPAGKTVGAPGWFPDMLPTFCELAQTTAPISPALDGQSLAGLLKDPAIAPKPRPVFYWEFHESGFSQALLMDERWKAIRLKGPSESIQLFDTQTDVAELKNVATENPALIERATALFQSERTESVDWPIRPKKAE